LIHFYKRKYEGDNCSLVAAADVVVVHWC